MTHFKQHFILLFCLLILNNGYSQEVKFRLSALNPFSGKIETKNFYSLYKDLSYSPKDSSGICILPDTGNYSLVFFDEKKLYSFKEFKEYGDTLRHPYIQPCIEPTTRVAFSGFCCCDTLCQGHKIDYYSNGNKRIDGDFKGGKPIGLLNFYYSNGKIKAVEKYNKKGIFIKKSQYNSTGKMIKDK